MQSIEAIHLKQSRDGGEGSVPQIGEAEFKCIIRERFRVGLTNGSKIEAVISANNEIEDRGKESYHTHLG